MKKIFFIIPVISLLLLPGILYANGHGTEHARAMGIRASYVMLYYKTLAAPRQYYGEVLGLESTFEDDWVSLYRLTKNSYVGVVKAGKSAWHKVQKENAVMLSIVVANVDGWYDRIRANPDVIILKEIYNNPHVPIRAFLMQDPGGYTVEMFQWLKNQNQGK